MKYQDLLVKKVWEGQSKPKWLKVGVLKTNDAGKQFVEINLFPSTDIYVFDQKEQEQKPQQQQERSIDVDKQDVPF